MQALQRKMTQPIAGCDLGAEFSVDRIAPHHGTMPFARHGGVGQATLPAWQTDARNGGFHKSWVGEARLVALRTSGSARRFQWIQQ